MGNGVPWLVIGLIRGIIGLIVWVIARRRAAGTATGAPFSLLSFLFSPSRTT